MFQTYNAGKLSFDRLISRLDLLGHQLKLITFLPTLVEVLAQYQQCFTLAVQLTLTRLQLATVAQIFDNQLRKLLPTAQNYKFVRKIITLTA